MDKPWIDLPLVSDRRARALFNSAVTFSIGNGQKTSFWHDPWLDSCCIADLAPTLYKCCTLRKISVGQALTGKKWLRHFKRDLPHEAILQFLQLYARLNSVQLMHGVQDSISWRWTTNGTYSTSSAYEMHFEGSLRFSFVSSIWKSDAPLKCGLFAWLAMLAKCNTADCLEKKRMPHNAACVLCLSSPESALHLLATCNVAINIWARIINLAGLPVALQPTPDVPSLQDWTVNTMRALPQPLSKAWLAVIHLTWWNI
jgi:hypothetical protein